LFDANAGTIRLGTAFELFSTLATCTANLVFLDNLNAQDGLVCDRDGDGGAPIQTIRLGTAFELFSTLATCTANLVFLNDLDAQDGFVGPLDSLWNALAASIDYLVLFVFARETFWALNGRNATTELGSADNFFTVACSVHDGLGELGVHAAVIGGTGESSDATTRTTHGLGWGCGLLLHAGARTVSSLGIGVRLTREILTAPDGRDAAAHLARTTEGKGGCG
jgi:hypothetical protein